MIASGRLDVYPPLHHHKALNLTVRCLLNFYDMTLEEFRQCKVGDNILSSIGKKSTIEDIDRAKGMITIGGGKWRHFSLIKLDVIKTSFTSNGENIIINKKLLIKYGFTRTLILQAIHSAGVNGFIGSTEDLAKFTEFVSEEYTRNLIAVMCREKLIARERLNKSIYRFTLCNRNILLPK